MSGSPKKQNFCCVENFSVMIPYHDLEKLLEIGNRYDDLMKQVKRQEERLTSLHGIQTEIIEKIREIQSLL